MTTRRNDHAAVVEIAQKLLQRSRRGRRAWCSRGSRSQQHDHVIVDTFDQEMIEADLAELVDDDGGVGERRIVHQTIEQRGLAGAEKAGEHRERDRLGGLSRAGRSIFRALSAVPVLRRIAAACEIGLALGRGYRASRSAAWPRLRPPASVFGAGFLGFGFGAAAPSEGVAAAGAAPSLPASFCSLGHRLMRPCLGSRAAAVAA